VGDRNEGKVQQRSIAPYLSEYYYLRNYIYCREHASDTKTTPWTCVMRRTTGAVGRKESPLGDRGVTSRCLTGQKIRNLRESDELGPSRALVARIVTAI